MTSRLRRLVAPLGSRLVITAVALVLAVSLMIGTFATIALRETLMDRLDRDVRDMARGVAGPGFRLNLAPGSVYAELPQDGEARGTFGDLDPDEVEKLSTADLEVLREVDVDARPHDADLPEHGTFRVIAQAVFDPRSGRSAVVVTGRSTDEVDDTIASLVFWETLLTLLGVLAAAGAGYVVVRRQLSPLREVAATAHTVAALPLSSGEVSVTERVPERLTDEDTEVGQVGAALNALLDHVDTSLAERHRTEQQVRQFVADASHELRTPLTTIRGYTELAQQRAEAVPMALGKVEEESLRMTALVEDLLLLARLDQGRPLAREPVDLTRLLLEAVDDARVVAPSHTWRLELPADGESGDAEVTVTGDAQRLHEVISNLLTNERRHTPAGTTVTVRVRPDGFDVHDDGPGFPPDLVPRAFERFTRADEARQRDGGAGLGLAIVHAVVTAHGGTVSLASVPGDTTIAVRLPAR
ncbi:two-component system OmpR family sensor kinase [Nocardioides luteus]|uniref:histidine kinase n=1 Tax=Nocardioides luteus TaxID=1844 RepID=A0ABQ5SUC7_9ACTN|nr:ATP-binding protein [Nocardioides luteus]MDR7309913.1 two-component system OmpR family sensor kinase [Nocardioides luteus]GGR59610.1 two-component sensor histidine kinase [Nocardioides luteus]GLJ67178.1 two-component sensor histidine kinase [Nocardioides luteus]